MFIMIGTVLFYHPAIANILACPDFNMVTYFDCVRSCGWTILYGAHLLFFCFR